MNVFWILRSLTSAAEFRHYGVFTRFLLYKSERRLGGAVGITDKKNGAGGAIGAIHWEL